MRGRKALADAVIRLFEWDHLILHSLGGSDQWWNLDPKLTADHREKSRRDTGIVAKVKRIGPAWREFTRKMALPDRGRSERKQKRKEEKIEVRCQLCGYKVRSRDKYYAEVRLRKHMESAHEKG